MAGGTVYRELHGEELAKQLQDVTERDIVYLEDLRVNGGVKTKELLEKFGREKLGIELNKTFKTDRLINEGLLPVLKERLGFKVEPVAPISSVVTPESMEDTAASIAEDMPTSVAGEAIQEMTTGDKPIAAPGYPAPLKRKPVNKVPEFLKNINTGNWFIGTEVFSKMSHMYPCNKDGKLLSEI